MIKSGVEEQFNIYFSDPSFTIEWSVENPGGKVIDSGTVSYA